VIIDMAGVDNRNPYDDYRQLLAELKMYNPEILEKKRIIVANKMDLPEAKKNLIAFKRKATTAPKSVKKKASTKTKATRPGIRVLEISALDGVGLEKLKLELHKALS
jgi:GTP-binding protein